MGRPPRLLADLELNLPPLRGYWREINRQASKAQAQERAKHRARDQRRPKCRCGAYPWPHRPAGGFCRYPGSPVERWQPKPSGRPYRKRYTGLRRQIARASGLHPIRDRAAIDARMSRTMILAKELKRRCPRVKYRNITLTENGISGRCYTDGPMM
ncbi:MAG: hypothetical protein WCI73_06115 [Phycisphaerae bacterium]